jgi:hypothetical protein
MKVGVGTSLARAGGDAWGALATFVRRVAAKSSSMSIEALLSWIKKLPNTNTLA